MHWLRTTFRTWAKSQGIELLNDDIKFLERILNKLPEKLHKSLVRDYCYEWLECIKSDEKSSQNQNKGRHKANSWMLKQLE